MRMIINRNVKLNICLSNDPIIIIDCGAILLVIQMKILTDNEFISHSHKHIAENKLNNLIPNHCPGYICDIMDINKLQNEDVFH